MAWIIGVPLYLVAGGVVCLLADSTEDFARATRRVRPETEFLIWITWPVSLPCLLWFFRRRRRG